MAKISGGVVVDDADYRPLFGAGAPVDGTTGAGQSPPGSHYVDTTNALAYVNRGTKASPVWAQVFAMWTNAGAPVNGTTRANQAQKGDLLIDTTNAKLYINTNTLASPTWTVVGSQT